MLVLLLQQIVHAAHVVCVFPAGGHCARLACHPYVGINIATVMKFFTSIKCTP